MLRRVEISRGRQEVLRASRRQNHPQLLQHDFPMILLIDLSSIINHFGPKSLRILRSKQTPGSFLVNIGFKCRPIWGFQKFSQGSTQMLYSSFGQWTASRQILGKWQNLDVLPSGSHRSIIQRYIEKTWLSYL